MKKNLPEPEGAAKKHSEQCLQMIHNKVEKKGAISFAEYMRLALYAPGLGYYVAGAEKFGAAGDFVTAPEISPLFSQCLANQCRQVLQDVGGDILEIGPGSGIMAKSIMQHLAETDSLPDHYYLLEVSPDLQARQRALLKEQCADYFDRFVWLCSWPQEPLTGIILANEVLDAMPVDIFEWQDNDLQACHVVLDENKSLQFALAPAKKDLIAKVDSLNQKFSSGYRSEINQALFAWLQGLFDSLRKGLCILIDYGYPAHEYYHPDRSDGTLMCHYRHVAHTNPLVYPGIQDITAHVDFTTVALEAENIGFHVAGYTQQAYFLMNCGIDRLISNDANTKEYFTAAQAIKKLTLPHEMGELFKVMALAKNYDQSLLGFKNVDQRKKLLPMSEE